MDAKTVLDKLKIVNFWRCLDSDGVKLWKGKFTQVYKRPSASNDRKAADQFARVQKAIESDLLAMEALREDAETEYVYVGLADRPAIQAAAAQATASKKRSKKNKRKRRTSTEPPTNSNQIYDRTAQNGWIRIEKGVGHHFLMKVLRLKSLLLSSEESGTSRVISAPFFMAIRPGYIIPEGYIEYNTLTSFEYVPVI
jgi:hypothetical protein